MKSTTATSILLTLSFLISSGQAANAAEEPAISSAERARMEAKEESRLREMAKPYCKQYWKLLDSKNFHESVEYAIDAHHQLVARGYQTRLPLPINYAAWDCIKRKDYKTARRVYLEILSSATGDLWVLPQISLWDLSITEGNTKETASQIEDFLASNKRPEQPLYRRAFYSMLSRQYDRLSDEQGKKAMEKLLNDKHCPKCGSDKNIELYTYGYVSNKGCMRTDFSPQYRCTKDDLEF